MEKDLYLVKYNTPGTPAFVTYVLAESRIDAQLKVEYVVKLYKLPFVFTVSKGVSLEDLRDEIRNCETSLEIILQSIYGTPDDYHINHFLLGEYVEDYDYLSEVLPPPDGYIQAAIEWFKKKEYYEINAKIRKYEDKERGHSVPKG